MLSRYVVVSSFNRYISYSTSMALPSGNTLNIGSGHLAEAPMQMQSYPLVSSIVKIYLWWAAPVTTIAWCAFRFSQYRYHLIRDGPVASCITSTVAWFAGLQRTVGRWGSLLVYHTTPKRLLLPAFSIISPLKSPAWRYGNPQATFLVLGRPICGANPNVWCSQLR